MKKASGYILPVWAFIGFLYLIYYLFLLTRFILTTIFELLTELSVWAWPHLKVMGADLKTQFFGTWPTKPESVAEAKAAKLAARRLARLENLEFHRVLNELHQYSLTQGYGDSGRKAS